jgi:hypothetical protein
MPEGIPGARCLGVLFLALFALNNTSKLGAACRAGDMSGFGVSLKFLAYTYTMNYLRQEKSFRDHGGLVPSLFRINTLLRDYRRSTVAIRPSGLEQIGSAILSVVGVTLPA